MKVEPWQCSGCGAPTPDRVRRCHCETEKLFRAVKESDGNRFEGSVKIGPVARPFWVVERYLFGKLHYWSAGAKGRGHADGWSLDIGFATKLADRESADQVMCRLLDGEGRSAEHSFLQAA